MLRTSLQRPQQSRKALYRQNQTRGICSNHWDWKTSGLDEGGEGRRDWIDRGQSGGDNLKST
jgi:hypothetical protein